MQKKKGTRGNTWNKNVSTWKTIVTFTIGLFVITNSYSITYNIFIIANPFLIALILVLVILLVAVIIYFMFLRSPPRGKRSFPTFSWR